MIIIIMMMMMRMMVMMIIVIMIFYDDYTDKNSFQVVKIRPCHFSQIVIMSLG